MAYPVTIDRMAAYEAAIHDLVNTVAAIRQQIHNVEDDYIDPFTALSRIADLCDGRVVVMQQNLSSLH